MFLKINCHKEIGFGYEDSLRFLSIFSSFFGGVSMCGGGASRLAAVIHCVSPQGAQVSLLVYSLCKIKLVCL